MKALLPFPCQGLAGQLHPAQQALESKGTPSFGSQACLAWGGAEQCTAFLSSVSTPPPRHPGSPGLSAGVRSVSCAHREAGWISHLCQGPLHASQKSPYHCLLCLLRGIFFLLPLRSFDKQSHSLLFMKVEACHTWCPNQSSVLTRPALLGSDQTGVVAGGAMARGRD